MWLLPTHMFLIPLFQEEGGEISTIGYSIIYGKLLYD